MYFLHVCGFMCVNCFLCCPAPFQNQEQKHGAWTYKYQCCYINKCVCGVEARIRVDKALVALEFKGRHHKNSHKGAANTRITDSQK